MMHIRIRTIHTTTAYNNVIIFAITHNTYKSYHQIKLKSQTNSVQYSKLSVYYALDSTQAATHVRTQQDGPTVHNQTNRRRTNQCITTYTDDSKHNRAQNTVTPHETTCTNSTYAINPAKQTPLNSSA